MSWNSAALPERPTLFIDRCAWSRALGEALSAAGIPYVAHNQRFAPAAADEEWLAGVADQGRLTIRLDERLQADLEHLSTEQKRTKGELVRDILRRHTSAELFQEARRRLKPHAERAGYLTDEEFFLDFS